MPRFSVIVPVYKVQGYLRECLDSVLTQSFTDFEVIAVDDCSPDHCGEILEEYAARDERVGVVHLAENGGLGHARNTGVAQASGDYLLFLDSDDTYAPGALRAIAERLGVTGDPDVLVFDHARTSWWGRGGRSATRDLLESAGTDTFNVFERPEFLHLFLIACNKAFRREFFLRHAFAFSPGLYEDAPVTYQVMVRAERIACLPRVCFEYRSRAGAITHTPGREHFDIFDQYGRLFDVLDRSPELEPMRPALFERTINHFLVTLPVCGRVRAEDRPDFYRRIADFYRSQVPADFTPPNDPLRTQFRLLAAGSPYPVFRSVVQLRARAATVKRRARAASTRNARRVSSRIAHARPLDPHLAVYGAFDLGGALGDPAALHAKAGELAPHIRGVWAVRPDAVEQLPAGADHVVLGSPEYARVMARATYFFNNVNWPYNLVKRPGAVRVQTHQGTPLKHMGTDLLDRPLVMSDNRIRSMLRQCDHWDYSLVAGGYAQQIWDRAYPCHFTSLPSGSPRNDALVRPDPLRAEQVRGRLGIPAGNSVVLYAPTPRDYHRRYTARVDLENLARALDPGTTLLVRLHHRYRRDQFHDRELLDLQERGLLLDVSHGRVPADAGRPAPTIEDLMLASDVLVTDYSSLLFDYVHLDRPIVVHADDRETYQVVRGSYFDIRAQAPGQVTTSSAELTALLASEAWRGDADSGRRAAFRDRFCEYDDGQAAERVVRRILLGEDLLPRAEPSLLVPGQADSSHMAAR
ncbi:bifunctional glycosyltransferase/CDP-glycerol:glycerophosphate glycerophosphotransferase [Streptomyces cavernicola]|uniref:CDP-glycerol glycerophosphotransferase family protein n=1 Tax=Streptomyces cavernicola TaxID=3043613 RepID=A0ABT6S8I0_9ACTN|nr:bifunctional glycosyltransferase/CDP-glycerol:glycerophosphate glycerophosphotransferase [Streptomyces sp. B-S-A6]MDI3404412.1 CDP-glycerol glycerophosphotransferase family protein [Streptomyces sp. B-S-A6]